MDGICDHQGFLIPRKLHGIKDFTDIILSLHSVATPTPPFDQGKDCRVFTDGNPGNDHPDCGLVVSRGSLLGGTHPQQGQTGGDGNRHGIPRARTPVSNYRQSLSLGDFQTSAGKQE